MRRTHRGHLELPEQLARPALVADARGGTGMLEMLIVVALVAFVGVAGAQLYGGSVNDRFMSHSSGVVYNGAGDSSPAQPASGSGPGTVVSASREHARDDDELVIELEDDAPPRAATPASASIRSAGTPVAAKAASKGAAETADADAGGDPFHPALPWAFAALLAIVLLVRYARRLRERRKQRELEYRAERRLQGNRNVGDAVAVEVEATGRHERLAGVEHRVGGPVAVEVHRI